MLIKKILLLAIITLQSTFELNAQQSTFQLEFYNSPSDDVAGAVQNFSGNYIVAGYTYSTVNGFDPIITEVSALGSILKSKTFTSTTNEVIKTICLTSDGGYIIAGYTYSTPSDYNWLVIKLDSSFNTIFYKQLGAVGGNDLANSCFEISPGHYVITGTVGLGGSAKPSVVTLDSTGSVIQQGYLTTNLFASPEYRGHYLGNGEIGFSHLTNAITIMDTIGNVVKQYPYSFGIYSTDVIKANNGEFACVSVSNYGSPSGSNLAFARIDSTLGTFNGGINFHASGRDLLPVSLYQDSYNNYIIVANAYDANNDLYTPVIIKMDELGAIIWSKKYLPSTTNRAKFNSCTPTADGGYILSGAMGAWNNQHQFLVKIDSSGNSGCNTATYNLTTLALSPNAITPHSAFTGTINALTPSAFNTQIITLNQNLICQFTGVKENSFITEIQILPTLFSDGFRIIPQTNDEFIIDIYSTNGVNIFNTKIHSESWVDGSKFVSGCYLVRMINIKTKKTWESKVFKY